ncbi:hypothetical protein H1D32_16225 [Anaerobacillus sp. CMMVII]|uniref:hypothetical protein n=1 Tax=Anaerobacillus sp. CMMVII TaxID=2755588 RepID=UPI0021C501F0|nr:hypothetical protein [Anaerobacillus sp. CMMVII]MCT8139112.1 hypothetical protein [Anaerobacillus sp. CMMVII]
MLDELISRYSWFTEWQWEDIGIAFGILIIFHVFRKSSRSTYINFYYVWQKKRQLIS